MSRIHSGRRGRSGSHRPYPPARPTWVSLEPAEVVEEAVRLAKGGMSAAQVGTRLRDQFGIPSVRSVMGKRMVPLLAENGVKGELPEDLRALLKRVVHLQRHLAAHPKDHSNRRGLQLMEARIRRLARYYRQKRLLPEHWSYAAASAVLQVE